MDNERRLTHLHEICEAYKLPDLRSHKKSTKDHKPCHITDCPVFVEKKHNFLYCNIAKVGCSTFKNELFQLAGMNPVGVENIHPYADNKLLRVSPNYFNDTSNFTRFMFVRHPFERLASAFNDKADRVSNPAVLRYLWAPIIKKNRKINNYTADFRPTFREFVLYLIDTPTKNYNEHWLPFWFRCAPCTVTYDFIGKMETFSRDKKYLYNKLGIGNIFRDTWINRSNSSEKQKEYFSQITKVELLKLYQKYYEDFLLFGYSLEPFTKYVKQ